MTVAAFQKEINRILLTEQQAGAKHVDVVSGDVHRAVGGYPPPKGKNHHMPLCCDVMREMMRDGDVVLQSPRKGQGATLTIRYRLPR
jgi:5-methylcytosine-specific restriction protein A